MFIVLRGTTYICTLTFSSPRFTTLIVPTFSVRPRSLVGRATVDLNWRSWVRFPPKVIRIFSLPRVVPWYPLLGLTPSGFFMGLHSTLTYTSELILCFTICVHSATRHNIYMHPANMLSPREQGIPTMFPSPLLGYLTGELITTMDPVTQADLTCSLSVSDTFYIHCTLHRMSE